jgi:hypothetical protein
VIEGELEEVVVMGEGFDFGFEEGEGSDVGLHNN